MEIEISKRKEAINQWLQGKKAKEIAINLNRTRQWVYKWIKRYKNSKDSHWYQSESRAPNSNPKKLSPKQEEHIIAIRKKLTGQKYSQIGAINIQYEFYRQGIEAPPIWTINRVLSKNGLVAKPNKIKSKNIAYPNLYYNCHQMDIVGPRYLKGGYRFYVLNIIDVETHFVHIHPIPGKSADLLIEGLISFWQFFGMPDSLQMDNELAFRGSNRYPRSLGMILRFVLSQDVIPIFIPPGEPWRNGIIEKFNNTFDKQFFRVQQFINLEQLKNEAKHFCKFHNNNHRYSSQGNKTPAEICQMEGCLEKLAPDYKLPSKIDLEEGTILFVRFIRSDLKISILGSEFFVKKELMYSYVVAELVVEIHSLRIKQDEKVHHVFKFTMPVDW